MIRQNEGALVPLVNSVVVNEDWFDLEGAQKAMVLAGTVVHVECYHRVL